MKKKLLTVAAISLFFYNNTLPMFSCFLSCYNNDAVQPRAHHQSIFASASKKKPKQVIPVATPEQIQAARAMSTFEFQQRSKKSSKDSIYPADSSSDRLDPANLSFHQDE